MYTLHLLKYNNYYNRIVKRESSLSAYGTYQVKSEGADVDTNGNSPVIEGVNFVVGNFIDTTQVVNWGGDVPDYLLAVEDNVIKSRWFVIYAEKTRGGQLLLHLHRDVIVDFYDVVVNAECFVEKAMLDDSDPMIFNSEDMTFNQIKRSETLLQDETRSAWIVGYCTSKTDENIEADFNAAVGADEAVAGIANYKYYKYSNLAGSSRQDLAGFPSIIAYCVYATYPGMGDVYKVCFNSNGGQPCGEVQTTASGGTSNRTGYDHTSLVYSAGWNPTCRNTALTISSSVPFTSVDKWVTAFKNYYSTLKAQLPNYIPISSEAETIELNGENGKIIYDSSTQKYYQVSIEKEKNAWAETPIAAGNMYDTFTAAYNIRAANYDAESGHSVGDWKSKVMLGTTPNSSTFAVRTYGAKYKVTLTALSGYGASGYNVKLGADRYHLNDAPYDMFAIPYSDDLKIYKNGAEILTANKLLAYQAVMALVRKYQSAGYIYDVQLLPFCPVRNMIKPGGIFDIGDAPVDYITSRNTAGITTNIGVVVYASNSSDTFNIPFQITYANKKIAAMCDMHRLASPNFNGIFEFNAAMNDGVNYFNVDFTYKPFVPYIHINPDFGGLYGQDFNDSRGLICGGEFSLPAVADQWDTYELQNKNYQNIFDRQVQNMEIKNSVQREQELWGMAAGVLGAGAQAGIAGNMVGGGLGAGVASVVGVGASVAGGIRDYQLNQRLRSEALDYTKDMFGYQLGNIKALPYTLTRTTAFSYNNKIFPILEYFTCTDEEKRALESKIKYNGMTVMRIGKVVEFIREAQQGYVKARFIRQSDDYPFAGDYHILEAVADELFKGVFI